MVVVEVRQGTLGGDGRGWGPAGNTGRGWSWLRSDREHCASRVAVEQEEEERRGGEEQATDIKSNNPHLAGGEKCCLNHIFVLVPSDLLLVMSNFLLVQSFNPFFFTACLRWLSSSWITLILQCWAEVKQYCFYCFKLPDPKSFCLHMTIHIHYEIYTYETDKRHHWLLRSTIDY